MFFNSTQMDITQAQSTDLLEENTNSSFWAQAP